MNVAKACPVCGTDSPAVFPTLTGPIQSGSREFGYRACPDCRLLFCDPLPTADEIRRVYSEYYNYTWFVQHRYFKRVQAWHRYWRFRRLVGVADPAHEKRRLLDVGCGHGWFLQEALRDGWDCYGLEFLQDALIARMKQGGVQIENVALDDYQVPPESFDVITLWHTLEHLPNPRQALQKVAELLRPGGYAVIAVPNRDSAGLTRMGSDWTWLQEPFVHLWCFSAQALQRIFPRDLIVDVVTSRDTWDQQYCQYLWPFPAWNRLLHRAFLAPQSQNTHHFLRPVAKVMRRTYFLAYEGTYVATYLMYMAMRPWLRQSYEQALRGSELLIILRKTSG